MKRTMIYFLVITVVLSALLAMSSPAQDLKKLVYPKLGPVPTPKVDKITLDNGMRLYLLEDRSLPIIHASVRINGGAYLEPATKIGLSGICGTVLRTGGTTKWTGDQIDEMLENVGASVETYVGQTSAGAGMNVLSDYCDLGLEVLAEVLRHPVFNQDKIDLSKVEERAAISRRNDDAGGIGNREFAKAIYGPQSVYARQTEYKTIDNVTQTDLIQFHAAVFHPENTQIAIWGDFDVPQMVEKIKKYFGDWEKGQITIPPVPKVDYTWPTRTYFIQKSDVNQSNVYVGHIGGLISDPDYAACIIMNNVLGGAFGSRLFNAVRSREGLAYTAFGVYGANFSYPGLFYNYAATKSATTVKATKEIVTQIRRMQTDPPTPEEMSVAKDGYVNSFVFNFDSRSKVVNRLMNYDFYNLPEDFLQQQLQKVEKVTPADVMAAAKKNLHPDSLVVLIVGKGEELTEGLDQLGRGKVDTLDITIPSGEEKKELAITPENLAKGKELLSKAVAAHGGLAAFKKIKAISSKGTLTLSTPQGDFALQQTSIEAYPDKSKQTMTVMGQTMLAVRNGTAGWKTGRGGTLEEMTAEDFKEADKDFARNPIYIFMTSDKSANQIVYAGSGDVSGTKVENVAVVDAEGKTLCTLALDAQSSRIVALSYWGKSMMGEGTLQEVYSDFKPVSGLTLPWGSTLTLNGQKLGTTVYSEYQVNPVIPAGTFDKPK